MRRRHSGGKLRGHAEGGMFTAVLFPAHAAGDSQPQGSFQNPRSCNQTERRDRRPNDEEDSRITSREGQSWQSWDGTILQKR